MHWTVRFARYGFLDIVVFVRLRPVTLSQNEESQSTTDHFIKGDLGEKKDYSSKKT